jgi:amidase
MPHHPFNPLTTTVSQLQSLLDSGSLTSVQILQTYLSQIEKHNKRLKAIISIAPLDSLLSHAQKLDDERKAGELRGPLHGVPLVVKDTFTFAPEIGLKTTVGSHVFAREKAKGNAVLIQQLIDQGVMILGTANLTVCFVIIWTVGLRVSLTFLTGILRTQSRRLHTWLFRVRRTDALSLRQWAN